MQPGLRTRLKILRNICLAFALAIACVSCDNDDSATHRDFYMGFTPFPYAYSEEARALTYAMLSEDGDIINHHFDDGVPWTEAQKGQPFHSNIMDDWSYRKSLTPAGHKICVSVSPFRLTRDGLATYRGEKEDMPLPSPWNKYQFKDEPVKTAYLNYCKRLIDFFDPDYFNMAMEANLLYVNKPEKWSSFLAFHEYIYQELKAEYPDVIIFSSVTGAHLLNGFIEKNDHTLQRLVALQVIANSDLYGISFYPYLSDYRGNSWPEGTFDDLFNLSSKPIAIAETGYPAQTFDVKLDSTEIIIEADQIKQDKFISDLLETCSRYNTKFVINFTIRDYDQLWEEAGATNNNLLLWRDIGLYDENGNRRAAYATWKQFLAKPVRIN